MTIADEAIEVLRLTHDGNDLAPHHLALVQLAANANIYEWTEAHEVAWAELLANARAGYKKPWLCGVENLTIDLRGFVFWKGQEIEHWSGALLDFQSERAMKTARELERRCKILEARGEEISTGSVVWRWKEEP